MSMMKKHLINIILAYCFIVACSPTGMNDLSQGDKLPDMFPDYTSVTIPPNIAPLNFRISDSCNNVFLVVTGKNYSVKHKYRGNKVIFQAKEWKQLLKANTGGSIELVLSAANNGKLTQYKPFRIYIANEQVDSYLVYRNLMPGFQNWNRMGIYQRSLTGFRVKTVLDSRITPGTCMNCHSFARNDPENMVLHLREYYGGTILYTNGNLEKLDTRTEKMFASAAFPYWHPSKKYIAFSVNKVNQIFHASGTFRAAALDMKSDIVLYDIGKHEMKTEPNLSLENKFETFPCFSPDGKTLYYCSADAKKMPVDFKMVRYSLCAVPFDENTGEFGPVPDTLISASETGKSVSVPRVSPDGKFLMFNMTDYGAFPSYNPEADIWLLNLGSREFYPLDSLNSNNVESYHSWSANGRWVAFSSRRMDGLYSNVYISYIDEEGNARKPFLLPQKDPDFYDKFLYSFNVPEFATKAVPVGPYQLEKSAKSTHSVQVQSGSH